MKAKRKVTKKAPIVVCFETATVLVKLAEDRGEISGDNGWDNYRPAGDTCGQVTRWLYLVANETIEEKYNSLYSYKAYQAFMGESK